MISSLLVFLPLVVAQPAANLFLGQADPSTLLQNVASSNLPVGLQQASNLMSTANVGPYIQVSSLNLVSDRTLLPPSGNPRDFATFATYYWPDACKMNKDNPAGLDFVGWDGNFSPYRGMYEDGWKYYTITTTVVDLAWISWWKWKQGKSEWEIGVRKSVSLLDKFFTDTEVGMIPSLEFAQIRPFSQNGTGVGTIDISPRFPILVDAIALLQNVILSESNLNDLNGFVDRIDSWLLQFHQWMRDSKTGKSTALRGNNIAAWFLGMRLATANHLLHRTRIPSSDVQDVVNRMVDALREQVNDLGQLPAEMGRADSFHYCQYAMDAWIRNAVLTDRAYALTSNCPYCPDRQGWGILWKVARSSVTTGLDVTQSLIGKMLSYHAPYIASLGTTWAGSNGKPQKTYYSRFALRRGYSIYRLPLFYCAFGSSQGSDFLSWSGSETDDRTEVLWEPWSTYAPVSCNSAVVAQTNDLSTQKFAPVLDPTGEDLFSYYKELKMQGKFMEKRALIANVNAIVAQACVLRSQNQPWYKSCNGAAPGYVPPCVSVQTTTKTTSKTTSTTTRTTSTTASSTSSKTTPTTSTTSSTSKTTLVVQSLNRTKSASIGTNSQTRAATSRVIFETTSLSKTTTKSKSTTKTTKTTTRRKTTTKTTKTTTRRTTTRSTRKTTSTSSRKM